MGDLNLQIFLESLSHHVVQFLRKKVDILNDKLLMVWLIETFFYDVFFSHFLMIIYLITIFV